MQPLTISDQNIKSNIEKFDFEEKKHSHFFLSVSRTSKNDATALKGGEGQGFCDDNSKAIELKMMGGQGQ